MQRIISSLLLIPLVLLVIWAGGFFFKIFIAVVMMMAFYEFFMLARLEHSSTLRYGATIGAACYCLLAFWAAISIPVNVILFILFAVWASDSGAYLFGKTFGGPKLAPRLSPNKTIAGLVGACMMPAAVLSLGFAPRYDLALLYGVMIGCIGQMGDIMVSAVKRRAGVKDTGRLIPGHGGVLDRIDALILVVIIFWIGMETEILGWPDTALLF